jgi:hypothetical protein
VLAGTDWPEFVAAPVGAAASVTALSVKPGVLTFTGIAAAVTLARLTAGAFLNAVAL